jgi:acetyl esterase/lipase
MKFRKPLVILLTLLVTTGVVTTTLAARCPECPKRVIHETHVVCGKSGDQDLTLEYMFNGELADRRKPVVATIPGGGWLHGGMKSVADPANVAPYLDAGFMVVGLRYRPITEAPFPACRDDIRTALDWLIAEADTLGIRRDAIALDGGSAGGHLATLTAALEAKHRHPNPVRAVILRGPPMDIARWFVEIHDNEVLNRCVRLLLSGTPDEKPDVCRDATPLTHISPGMPPFLIFHGEKDTAVPLTQTLALAERLKQAGVSVKRVVVQNGTHGLGPADDTGSSPNPEEIFQMKVEFLKRCFSGHGDPNR